VGPCLFPQSSYWPGEHARLRLFAAGCHHDAQALLKRGSYFKELRVIGSNGFGIEELGGVAKHSMEHYFDFVAGGLDLTPVITHRFPLERWDQAVLALKDSRRTGAVKVLLEPSR
jgi:threonine dehydrogenase-like Zn-dependent dehydrogenase